MAPVVLPLASPNLQTERCWFCPRTHCREAERWHVRPGLGPLPEVVTRIQGQVPLLSPFGTAGEAATGPAARSNRHCLYSSDLFWDRGLWG